MFRERVRGGSVLLIAAFAVLAGSTALADAGPGHQAAQARPIQLGTSGGNIFDISTLYCCSGTLGALVEDISGTQYILSNNHVLARFNQGIAGDPVNQPGMIDQGCQTNGAVASLTAFVPIKTSKGRSIQWNTVDAAIAQVTPGLVAANGPILDIGTLSGATLAAFAGQAVQKSGRTTGHTTGTVLAIDVNVSVGYSKECGGAANQFAYFQNQIRIGGAGFSAGGDSGSLIVESGTSDPETGLPRAVALLFAGDSTSTLANPINPVLSSLGVSLVGGAPVPPGPTGMIAGVVTDSATTAPITGATVAAGPSSTATDAAGAYVLEVPTGTYTVSVSAIGYTGGSQSGVAVNENTTTVVDFQLTPSPVASTARPGCVIYNTSGGRNGDKNITFSVKVVDNFGLPVAGAVVDISVTRNGAAFGNGTGAATNANGIVTYSASNAPSGTYVTTVTNINAAGLAFSGPGSTPVNSFVKGTDAVPASFCADGVSPNSGDAGRLTMNKARAANARNAARLMSARGVVGHGVGRDAGGNPVIEVYVRGAATGIPSSVDGVPVRVVPTDGFVAY